MLRYTIRKLLSLIPKLLLISLLIFFALELLPGDSLSRSMPPEQYLEMTEVQREALRESMGLNKPALVRYFIWVGNILKGDFGYSQATGANITTILTTRLPYTIELALVALILAQVFGLVVGFLTAIFKNTIIDYLGSGLSVMAISIPNFFYGIILLVLFAVNMKIFPTGGRMPVGDDSFIARIPYMILPALALGITYNGGLTRSTRSAMLDVLNKDYIKTARSKGLNELTVNIKHGFRNALSPVMTLICLDLPKLVGGSVVIETTFNYPAIGGVLMEAISAGDIPVVMVITMTTAMVTLVASCLVDIVTAALDPRIRFE